MKKTFFLLAMLCMTVTVFAQKTSYKTTLKGSPHKVERVLINDLPYQVIEDGIWTIYYQTSKKLNDKAISKMHEEHYQVSGNSGTHTIIDAPLPWKPNKLKARKKRKYREQTGF